jgi:CheY-like chemotaxis protein
MLMRPLQRVLVVEDDPDIQALAALALSRLGGITAEICSSGRQAVEHAQRFHPDMILLDVMMPGMDGPATLEALRRVSELRSIPVVFLTARVLPHEIGRYRALGCLDVIAKPFIPSDLPQMLRQLWARHERVDGGADGGVAESSEFAALRRSYLAELPRKLSAVAAAVDAVFARRDPTAVDALCDLAHRLVGSSALYGLVSTSEAARALETRAMSLAKAGPFADPAQRPELDSLLAALWSAQTK